MNAPAKRGTKVFTKAEYLSQADNYEKNVRPGLKARGIDQPYMRVIESAMEKNISDKGSEQTINSYGVSLED